jgi:hypothetical protein
MPRSNCSADSRLVACRESGEHPGAVREQRAPAKETQPIRESWQAQATATLVEQQLAREAQRRARFIVATNVLDPSDLADEEAIGLYKAQSGVERGFSFLKDPLFLASSVFLKKWVCRQRHLIG